MPPRHAGDRPPPCICGATTPRLGATPARRRRDAPRPRHPVAPLLPCFLASGGRATPSNQRGHNDDASQFKRASPPSTRHEWQHHSPWLRKCVEDVEQSGVATFVLVLRAAPEGAPGPFRFLQGLRRFLFWLYKNVDRRLFRSSPDAHAPIDLRSALPNCRVLDGADLLQEEQLDVVLDPLCLLPDRCLAETSRYGVWSVAFGQSGDQGTQSTPAC